MVGKLETHIFCALSFQRKVQLNLVNSKSSGNGPYYLNPFSTNFISNERVFPHSEFELSKLKSGIFGQTAKFEQPICFIVLLLE